MKIFGNRSPILGAVVGISLLFLLVLTVCAVMLGEFGSLPLDILITTALLVFCGSAITLYIGEMVAIGWIMDFLSEIGMPIFQPVPLEYEQVDEVIVVKLSDNIATVRQCQAVQKQLKRLIDEHHCDFVLDFLYAEKISRSFRGVMVYVMKATRREAERLGRPFRPVVLPHGQIFRVFDDRERAVEEMSKHDGHGWVVLCSVPVGIRAVYDLT